MKLEIFNTANLFDAATDLFQQLGIKLNSNTAGPLPAKDLLKQHYKENQTFKNINHAYFIGIIDNTVFNAAGMFDVNYSYKEALQQGDKNYDGLMLFALDLSKQPTRSEISDLTRTFNRISQKMPVALVLKYPVAKEAVVSIAISERFKYKQNWRQGEKAGKVIILRDIHTQNTHAGHQRILLDLVKPAGVSNYEQLHQHWLQVLDVNILNKRFFQELANWYFWAMDNVSFPDDLEKKKDIRNATNLIRLITRVVFIWFIKEKFLVPGYLFNETYLNKILKDFNKNKKSQNYYRAILQNLFFGTLNQKMNERKFAKEGGIDTNKEEYGVKNLLRYADLFTIPEKEALQLFKDVPFLNGGLFDCLDKPNEDGKIVYVDGFSRNPKKQSSVPDYIFFGEEREVDLNEIFATKNKKYKSRGLINLLESYKFTVAENTPIEEEIALDPELLGKVFENLLASYNPETQTTARKQTGSFYTPREIVNYMVDESLLEYIKQNVSPESYAGKGEELEVKLRALISYEETPNPFNEKETKALIESINNCKILDPACGSGAFPMGILHKMVHLLQKLDPENIHWKELQRKKAMTETETAFKIGDKEERGRRLNEINDVFENNSSDYGRKLYLIENCIYGIDIQPIAVQISKLRFFISLIIDQNKQPDKENFGIRSLPNLETKFVAANTLIGLDKPVLTLFRNPQIEEKENELKELRHKYFTANTRREKLQYQKLDKKLRQEIAKMLESDGWHTTVAKQIVAFDPYDQNTSANWFDPEWMFGLTTGFDIVVGNPPYITIALGKNQTFFTASEIIFYKQTYPEVFEYKGNTFALFIKAVSNNIKKGGILTFILPNTLLLNASFQNLRKYILTNYGISKLLNFTDDIFEAAVTGGNLVILLRRGLNLNEINVATVINFDDINHITYHKTANSLYQNHKSNNFILDTSTLGLENKILADSELLGSISTFYNGIKTGNNKRFLSDRKLNNNYHPIIRGRDIHRFHISFGGIYVLFDKNLLWSNTNETFLLKNPKIIIRQTSDTLIAALDTNPFMSMDTTHLIFDCNVNIKFILAVLNSRLMNWFYQKMVAETNRTFAEVKIVNLKKLPIRITKKENYYASVVDYIAFQKKTELDTSFFERLIDAMIYELYLPEEVRAGNAEVLRHLINLPELKEGLDEKNIKTIEKVYKEFSDHGHPISKALQNLENIEEVRIIEGKK
ncbi:MAG: N-6 DNA methylase [Ignavibacteriaceae bacterium]|nr:N-6 DNA methylase [Ignavibacteriaceae bacterium]